MKTYSRLGCGVMTEGRAGGRNVIRELRSIEGKLGFRLGLSRNDIVDRLLHSDAISASNKINCLYATLDSHPHHHPPPFLTFLHPST